MENRDKTRLRRNRRALMDIDPGKISDYLIQEEVFTPQMIEEILSKPTTKDRMGAMLNRLEKRGPQAYGKFRSVLLELETYDHLVELLDRTQLPVDVDEVDGGPVRQGGSRQEGSRPTGGVTTRGQGRNVSVIGNNNFAIVGGTDTKIYIH